MSGMVSAGRTGRRLGRHGGGGGAVIVSEAGPVKGAEWSAGMGRMPGQGEGSPDRGCCWCAVLDGGEGVSGMASS